MNQPLKLLISSTPRLLQLGTNAAGKGSLCQIHQWVRPTRYILRRRRIVEHEKFPERAKPQRRSQFSDWNYRAELYAFGKRLGEDFDEAVLQEVFIDKSYIHTEKKRLEELGLDANTITLKDNKELAECGLKLIRATLKPFIQKEFPKFPLEGVESAVNRLTESTVLGQLSFLIGTKDLIQCSDYPPPEDVRSTAFQAVVAAVEKCSGQEKAEKFILDFVASHLCGKDINEFWDISKPWHMLLEINKQQGTFVEPRLIREAGRNTLLSAFVVGIYDQYQKLLGTGIGETVDIAQEMAARDVLKGIFGTRRVMQPFQFQSDNFPIQLIPHVRNP